MKTKQNGKYGVKFIEILLIAAMSFSGACQVDVGKINAKKDNSAQTNTAPAAPNGITLVAPASSPGNNPAPTMEVSGVSAGDTVALFTDAACTAQVASALAAGNTIQLSSATLAEGSYTFYANAANANGVSPCSSASAVYDLDQTAPALTTVSLSSDNTNSSSLAKAGDTIAVSIKASEPINGPTVSLDGNNATVSGSGASYTATLILQNGQNYTQGNVSLLISGITDIADNASPDVSGATNGTNVSIDTSAPSSQNIVLSANNTVNTGGSIGISPAGAGNSVWLAPAGTTVFTAGPDKTTASGTAMSISVPANAGTYYVYVIDSAGNISQASTNTVTVVIPPPTAPTSLSLITPPVSPGTNPYPTIRVSGVAGGDTVKLFIDATCTTLKTQGSIPPGDTFIDFNLSLLDGSYTFYANRTNANGTSPCSTASVSYMLDSTAPTLTTVSISSSNSNSASLATTGDTVTLSITGSEPLGTPSVTMGGVSATVTGSGASYTAGITVGALAQGAIGFSVAYSDVAGNPGNIVTATTDSSSVTIDTAAPANENTVLSGSSSVSSGSSVTIAAAGAGNTVWLAPAGTTVFAAGADMTTASGTATSIAAPTAPGTYHLYVIDSAGNISVASTNTVTVTSGAIPNAPTSIALAVTLPSPSYDTTPTFDIGGVTSGNTVRLFTDSACMVQVSSGTASSATIRLTSMALAEGAYTFYANAANAAGVSTCSTASASYVVDTTPPSITAITISSDNATPTLAKMGDTITLSLTVSEDLGISTVYIAGTALNLNGSGTNYTATYSVIASSTNGQVYLNISTLKDIAWNTTTGPMGFANTITTDGSGVTIDKTPPANQNTVLAASYSVTGGSSITITAAGTGNTVWLAPAGTTVFTAGTDMTTASGTATSIAAPATSGTYYLYVVDPAGNVSAASTNSVTVNNTAAPSSLTLIAPAASPGNNSTPTIEVGGVLSGDTVNLYTDATCTTQVASGVSAGTTIQLTTSALTEGSYTFYADKTSAGGTSPCSTANAGYVLDLTAPNLTEAITYASGYAPGTSNMFAKNGSYISVRITSSESISTPVITIAGTAATVAQSGNLYVGYILVTAGAIDGIASFTVDFTDLAGNAGATVTTTSDGSWVTIDNTPPTLTLVSISSNNANSPSQAKEGDIITLSFTSSEDISNSSPVAKIAWNTVTVSGSGTSYTATHTVVAGDYQGSVQKSISSYYDAIGNAGAFVMATTDGTNVVIDTVAPSNQNIVLNASSTVTGGTAVSIAAAGAGNTAWLAPAGTTVFTAGADMTSAGSSATSITAPSITGTYYLYIVDAAGNISSPSINTVTVGTPAPPPSVPSSIALVTPPSSPGNDSTPTIEVSGVTSSHTVSLFTDSACTVQVASGTAAAATIQLTTSALADGTYTFYANATNAAGTSPCSTASVSYLLDTVPPANQDSVLTASPTVTGGTAVSITAAGAGNTVWLAPLGTVTFIAGSDITSATGTATSIAAPIAVGTYYLYVIDSAGNVSLASANSVSVNVTPPPAPPSVITLVTPASSPGANSTPTVEVGGVISGDSVSLFTDAICTLQVATGTSTGTTIQLTSSALTDGAYIFYANATNAGGASTCSSASVAYTLDTIAPTNQDSVLTASSTVAGGTAISITPAGAGNAVWLAPAGTTTFVAGANMTSATGTATSISAPATIDTYFLYVIDLAGNVSAPSTNTVTVNSNPPPAAPNSLTLIMPASSPSNDSTPTILVGGVTSGDTVALFTDATCITQVASIVTGGSTVSLTTSALPGDSTYTFYSNTTNTNGASSCSTASLSYTLDQTKPTMTITSAAAPVTSSSVIPITITFSEDVTGFTETDLTVQNGSINAGTFVNVTPNTVWQADITASALGNVTIDIAGWAVNDLAGNPNWTTAQLIVLYDNGLPPNLVSAETMDTDANGFLDHYKLIFDKPVLDSSFGGYVGPNSLGTANTGWDIGGYTLKLAPGTAAPEADNADDNILYVNLSGLYKSTADKPDIVTTASLALTDASARPLNPVGTLDIVEIDRAAPVMNYASSYSYIDTTLQFNEAVDASALTAANYTLEDATLNSVLVNSVTGNFQNNPLYFHLSTGPQTVGTVYTLTASNVTDMAGNVINPSGNTRSVTAIAIVWPQGNGVISYDSAIKLKWFESLSATGYYVYDALDNIIATLPAGTIGHTITGLTNGTSYTFKVAAFNDAGVSNMITYTETPRLISDISSYHHTIYRKGDGTLWGWGQNTYGQLGDGTTVDKFSPVQIGIDTDWKLVSAGQTHTLAIKEDGTLWAWGDNSKGQLGDGTTVSSAVPIRIGVDTDWKQVIAGNLNSFALRNRSGGNLWAWGDNASSQLGDGTSIDRHAPVKIGTQTWLQVSAGAGYTMGLTVGMYPDLYIWGTHGVTVDPVPVIHTPSASYTFSNVATSLSSFYYYAIDKSSGVLYREGDVIGSSFGIIDFSSQWLNKSIHFKNNHYGGVNASGSVVLNGDNSFGKLGDGTVQNGGGTASVTTDWYKVEPSAGDFTVALKNDGSLYVWGDRTKIGTGASAATLSADASVPVQVNTSTYLDYDAGSSNMVAIGADSRLYMAGSNQPELFYDRAGAWIYEDILSIVGIDTWTSIKSGQNNVYGIKSDNTLWVWGNNLWGKLGINNGTDQVLPVQTWGTWNSVSPGQDHTIGIHSTNALYAWGRNSNGQLGDGTTITSYGIQAVTVPFGVNSWLQASAGCNFSMARSFEATPAIYTWGGGASGELGDGTNTLTQTSLVGPIYPGLQGVADISAGCTHALAITSDGKLWGWGSNLYGQIAAGTASVNVPTQIGIDTNWVDVEAGRNFSMGLKSDGTLWAWGDNSFGQLGIGTFTDSATPVQVGVDTNWQSVKAGEQHVVAQKTDGTLWTWGDPMSGALGNQNLTQRTPLQLIIP